MKPYDTDDSDDLSIPLLDEVVIPEQLQEPPAAPARTGLTDQQLILQAVRDGLRSQLLQELQPVIASSVEQAIDQALENLRPLLRAQLGEQLEQQLRQQIESGLDDLPSLQHGKNS